MRAPIDAGDDDLTFARPSVHTGVVIPFRNQTTNIDPVNTRLTFAELLIGIEVTAVK